MAAYTFETITSAQALAYSSATDTISFGVPAASISIFFGGGQTIVMAGDRSVTFGAGFTGQTGASFSDGAKLFLGSAGSDTLTGASTRDLIVGGAADDVLSGADASDTLRGVRRRSVAGRARRRHAGGRRRR